MSTRYCADEWAVWLEEHRQSGLSVKEFCKVIEVSVAAFYNWRRKLKQQPESVDSLNSNTGSLVETNFSEVFLSNTVDDTVEIQLPAGASVKLANDVDSLRPILQVLAQIGSDS